MHQLGSPGRVGKQFNAEADFSQRYDADMEAIEWLRGNEPDDFGLRSRTTKL